MDDDMLTSIRKQFTFYKILSEKAIEQLNSEQIFSNIDEESNSIAIIMKHISGNMKSRFTNFLTEDGEKEWRKREQEFNAKNETLKDLKSEWTQAWQCLYDAIDNIDSLNEIVYIRNEGHTVFEALLRQLSHYAYHVGQIIWVAKHLKGSEWKSLSIPKGKTSEFNQAKFEMPKTKTHFLDNYFKE